MWLDWNIPVVKDGIFCGNHKRISAERLAKLSRDDIEFA